MPDIDDFEFGEQIKCPRCGATEGFKPAHVEESGGGAMLLLGGLLPFLLLRSAQGDRKVYCSRCHYVFEPKTPSVWAGRIVAIAILLFIAGFLAIMTWR